MRIEDLSLDQLVEFYDSHEFGEYMNQMPEANFEVGKQKMHL